MPLRSVCVTDTSTPGSRASVTLSPPTPSTSAGASGVLPMTPNDWGGGAKGWGGWVG
jgi:hypothetical protein